jgi:hypothetical protein
MRKYEVCVKEISEGYVVVNARSEKEATEIALRKCNRGNAIMGDELKIKTGTVKEIKPIGFQICG